MLARLAPSISRVAVGHGMEEVRGSNPLSSTGKAPSQSACPSKVPGNLRLTLNLLRMRFDRTDYGVGLRRRMRS